MEEDPKTYQPERPGGFFFAGWVVAVVTIVALTAELDDGQLDRNHINHPLATQLAAGDRSASKRPALHVAREDVETVTNSAALAGAAPRSVLEALPADAVKWQAGTNASKDCAETGALIASASVQTDRETILGLKELSRPAT